MPARPRHPCRPLVRSHQTASGPAADGFRFRAGHAVQPPPAEGRLATHEGCVALIRSRSGEARATRKQGRAVRGLPATRRRRRSRHRGPPRRGRDSPRRCEALQVADLPPVAGPAGRSFESGTSNASKLRSRRGSLATRSSSATSWPIRSHRSSSRRPPASAGRSDRAALGPALDHGPPCGVNADSRGHRGLGSRLKAFPAFVR